MRSGAVDDVGKRIGVPLGDVHFASPGVVGAEQAARLGMGSIPSMSCLSNPHPPPPLCSACARYMFDMRRGVHTVTMAVPPQDRGVSSPRAPAVWNADLFGSLTPRGTLRSPPVVHPVEITTDVTYVPMEVSFEEDVLIEVPADAAEDAERVSLARVECHVDRRGTEGGG